MWPRSYSGGVLTVLEEIKVKNIIIGKQFKDSENYQRLIKIAKEKKIKTIVVEATKKVTLEKNLYFEVLWPSSSQEITENSLNNNALVGRLLYQDFKMLFTGDIEEIAEREILKRYEKDLPKLRATVLKVAHHGSKTSSKKEFVEAVGAKYAFIGVGASNSFGHPSENTLELLRSNHCQYYRTDEEGEITIKTDGKKVKIEKCVK